jgi:hypothetical protein
MIDFEIFNPIIWAAVLNGITVLLTLISLTAAPPKLSAVKAISSQTKFDEIND